MALEKNKKSDKQKRESFGKDKSYCGNIRTEPKERQARKYGHCPNCGSGLGRNKRCRWHFAGYCKECGCRRTTSKCPACKRIGMWVSGKLMYCVLGFVVLGVNNADTKRKM